MMYGYGQVEDALAATFKVAAPDRPAFISRLRHLRDLGVPRVDKPGKGRKIAYGRNDAIEIALALEMVSLGLLPNQTVKPVRVVVKDGAYDNRSDQDVFMVIGGRLSFANGGEDSDHLVVMTTGLSPKVDWPNSRRVAIVNVTAAVKALDAELAKAGE